MKPRATAQRDEAWMRRGTERRSARIEEVLAHVCHAHEIARREILGESQSKTVAAARAQACRELRALNMSYTEIARALNYAHHTSVMHHCQAPIMSRSAQRSITISAIGEYPRTMPSDLMASLTNSIQQHMKAYGLEQIEVEAKHL